MEDIRKLENRDNLSPASLETDANLPEHEKVTTAVKKLTETDRLQHIKEMIELPEEDVSATRKPREARSNGLPLMFLMVIGIALVAIATMFIIYLGVGTANVNIILGNHFTK